MDMMNLHKESTRDLMDHRSILQTDRLFAKDSTYPDWVARLTHDIELIETELNRRVGDLRGM